MSKNQSKTEDPVFFFEEPEEQTATKSGSEEAPPQPPDDSDAQSVKLSKTSTKPIDIPQKKKEFVPEYPSGRPHSPPFLSKGNPQHGKK